MLPGFIFSSLGGAQAPPGPAGSVGYMRVSALISSLDVVYLAALGCLPVRGVGSN